MEQKTLGISKSSTLEINGDTNINSFKCVFDAQEYPDNLHISFKRKDNTLRFSNTSLQLNVNAFDCGSRPINKDFEALIQAKDYPYIQLNIKTVEFKTLTSAFITIEIKIAGVTNKYRVPLKINNNRYSGSIPLNINDYKLEPPKKVLGLIKVKDEISIDFSILLKD